MYVSKLSQATVLAAGLVGSANAFWRLECHGVAALAMIDPIVSPNEIARHAHTIKGGSGLTISSTADDLLKSDCTSCQVVQDKSAYWAPQWFFMNSNGSVHVVPEVGGHLTYYKYTPVYNSKGKLMMPEAPPNGLRIVANDQHRRNFTLHVPDPPRPWTGEDATQSALMQKAVGFNCLNYKAHAEDSLFRHYLPDKQFLEDNCPDGIRMEVLFPQCWNGELDSEDHSSHMAYPDSTINGGRCPPGFDHNIMQIFYETVYPTQTFKGIKGFYAFANGDPTGYGYHGDVMFAWEHGVLQQALDQCGSDTKGPGANGVTADCPVFKIQDQKTQAACKIPLTNGKAKLDIAKNILASALPGNNPIQSGPSRATIAPPENAPAPHPTTIANVVPTLAFSAGKGSSRPASLPASIPAKPSAVPSAIVHVGNDASSAPAPAPAPASSKAIAPAPAPAPSKSVAPAPAPVVVTPAPVPTHAAPAESLSTSVYTSNGAVYEVVYVVEEVTVTVDDYVIVEESPVAGKRQERRRQDRRSQHLRDLKEKAKKHAH